MNWCFAICRERDRLCPAAAWQHEAGSRSEFPSTPEIPWILASSLIPFSYFYSLDAARQIDNQRAVSDARDRTTQSSERGLLNIHDLTNLFHFFITKFSTRRVLERTDSRHLDSHLCDFHRGKLRCNDIVHRQKRLNFYVEEVFFYMNLQRIAVQSDFQPGATFMNYFKGRLNMQIWMIFSLSLLQA